MKQLVKFQADFSDEFYVYGFIVADKLTVNNIFQRARRFWEKNPNQPVVWYCEANDFIEFTNYKEYRECFKTKTISDAEAEVFKLNFNSFEEAYVCHYGEYSIFDLKFS
jgi:hypothetical protein